MLRRLRLVSAAIAVALLVASAAAAAGPTATITGGPAEGSTTGDTSATFTFESTDPLATFECRLNGDDFSACSSPKGYSGLESRRHTFRVRAVSLVDGRGPEASRRWIVDATPPNTQITGGPAEGATTDGSVSFSFTANESGSTFQCQLDGSGFSSCSSPQGYSGLQSGSRHTFEVRAIDEVGNVDPTPASRTWMVQVPPPPPPNVSGPASPTNDNTPTFTFSSNGAASYRCAVDNSAPTTTCSSPHTTRALADGEHTFYVRAVNAAGGVSDNGTHEFTIDTTPPGPPSVSGPASPTNDETPTFTFSSTGAASYRCAVDDSAPTATCSSPHTSRELDDGAHTFYVKAVDAAGNLSGNGTVTFTVDTTPPPRPTVSGPGSPTSDNTPTFSFSSAGAASYRCAVDNNTPTASCSSPHTTGALAAGAHTFYVRALDAAGNVSGNGTHAFTVKTNAPDTTITSGPAAGSRTKSASASFEFSANEAGSSFDCKLDDGAFASCTSPKGYADLKHGSHTFQVRARDGAGNTDPSPASRTWIVDLTPPVLTVPGDRTVEANGPSGSSVTYAVSAADDGVALLPGAISCKPESGATFELGTTGVECSATDSVGNTATKSFKVTVTDRTPPTINAPDVTVTATDSKGIDRSDRAIASYLASVSASDLVSRPTLTNDAPTRFPIGTSTVTFTARDAAGNTASSKAKVVVLPPGRPATPPDLKPPAKVSAAKAIAGDHRVVLTWKLPRRDVAYIVVTRAVNGDRRALQVFRGLASSYTDKRLRNAIEYRYVLISFDRAGNRSKGVVLLAKPKAQLLGRPQLGARLATAPLFAWAPVPAASYFNMQLWLRTKKGFLKVLSVWPSVARYQLPTTWVYEGKRHRLVPGEYTWYVWPGLGDRREVRYGEMLGKSTFVAAPIAAKVAKAALKPPAKAKS